MDLDIDGLAATAADVLVKKLATDGWERVVAAVGALWRRVHPERGDTVEAEAAETRSAALAAREAGDEAGEQDLVLEWQGRLRRLVANKPETVGELRRLLAEWDSGVSASSITMHVQASGHSRVTVAGRDVHVTR